MATRDHYVLELAASINAMFADGKIDPSADEIAEYHFEGKALGGEIVDGVRKRLSKLRNILHDDYEHPVYLVSNKYYAKFRFKLPVLTADARKCIPFGRKKLAAGIRLHTDGDNDKIYTASLAQIAAMGAGKVKRTKNDIIDSVDGGQLSEERGGELMKDTKRKIEPRKKERGEELEELPELEK